MPALRRRRGERLRGCLTMVAALGLALASTSLAGTVTCHTTHDEALQRLVITCSDGSRAVRRDAEELQRWQTQITPAPRTKRGTERSQPPRWRAPAAGREVQEEG
jgi:hypothetical protein